MNEQDMTICELGTDLAIDQARIRDLLELLEFADREARSLQARIADLENTLAAEREISAARYEDLQAAQSQVLILNETLDRLIDQRDRLEAGLKAATLRIKYLDGWTDTLTYKLTELRHHLGEQHDCSLTNLGERAGVADEVQS